MQVPKQRSEDQSSDRFMKLYMTKLLITSYLNRWVKSPLGRRLALATFVAVFVIEIIIFIPSFYNYREAYFSKIQKETIDVLSVYSSTKASQKGEGLNIYEDLSPLLSALNIKGVGILDDKQKIIATDGEKIQAYDKLNPKSLNPVLFKEGDRYEVYYPKEKLSSNASFIVRHDISDLSWYMIAFTLRIFGLVMIIASFTTFVAIIVLDALLIKGLFRLRNNLLIAAETPENAKRYSITSQNRDEFGEVITAFNIMLNRVEEGMVDLQKKADLEKELSDLRRVESLGQIAGGMAHEFNNMVGPMILLSEMVQDTLDEKSQEWKYCENIIQNGERAQELVQQILSISRKENEEASLLNLSEAIEKVMDILRKTIPSSVSIEEDISVEKAFTYLKPTALHQILINLCSNAVDAMAEGKGKIKISLSEVKEGALGETEQYLLAVKDNGQGMTEKVQKRIFDPFYTTKDAGKGTGMGMAVVFNLVQTMNGKIIVDSEVNKGTTFKVFIPKTNCKEIQGKTSITENNISQI